MRSSSHIRVWTCVIASLQEAANTSAASQCALNARHFSTHPSNHEDFSTPHEPTDDRSVSVQDATTTTPPRSSSSSPAAAPQRYRRRSSDPQTPREKGDFRRDYKYAKHRPLPDSPWRQLKTKTYLDDAERLYGRKETWQAVEDAVLREKLVAILQDYLRDTLAAARLEAKEARRYRQLCSVAAKQYRAHVSSGAFGLADGMQMWARDVLRGRPSAPSLASVTNATEGDGAEGSLGSSVDASARNLEEKDASSATSATSSGVAAKFREERRRRGEQAVLGHTAAMADLPDADVRHAPPSAFPFLRRRAVENEASLDPSLVDWTAKYFPEDDQRTFAEPPKLRTRAPREGTDEVGESDGSAASLAVRGGGVGTGVTDAASSGTSAAGRRAGSVHARHRLQRTLRDHENRHRATFDAEGVYYKVVRQSDVDERAPRPQAVKASDLEPAGRRPEVVKVPWTVASKAKAQGYSSDTLRAKERLIRLTRGEDPETIP